MPLNFPLFYKGELRNFITNPCGHSQIHTIRVSAYKFSVESKLFAIDLHGVSPCKFSSLLYQNDLIYSPWSNPTFAATELAVESLPTV